MFYVFKRGDSACEWIFNTRVKIYILQGDWITKRSFSRLNLSAFEKLRTHHIEYLRIVFQINN